MLPFLISVVLLTVECYGEDLFSGKIANSSTTCFRRGSQCSDDCSTLMYCAGPGTTPKLHRPCNVNLPSLPYCSNNRCSSTPNLNNPNCFGQFVCTDSGLFPDPTVCSRYHYCENTGAIPQSYQCPDGHVYDAAHQSCLIGLPANCKQNICPLRSDQQVAYLRNNSFYIECHRSANTGFIERVMRRCQDAEIFDNVQQQCVHHCSDDGSVYADANDCNKFFYCRRIGGSGRFDRVHSSCPDNHYFDGLRCVYERSKCVPKSMDESTTDPSEIASETTSSTYESTLNPESILIDSTTANPEPSQMSTPVTISVDKSTTLEPTGNLETISTEKITTLEPHVTAATTTISTDDSLSGNSTSDRKQLWW